MSSHEQKLSLVATKRDLAHAYVSFSYLCASPFPSPFSQHLQTAFPHSSQRKKALSYFHTAMNIECFNSDRL
jgi:hypothetical protein